jgi:hypothetical protein
MRIELDTEDKMRQLIGASLDISNMAKAMSDYAADEEELCFSSVFSQIDLLIQPISDYLYEQEARQRTAAAKP